MTQRPRAGEAFAAAMDALDQPPGTTPDPDPTQQRADDVDELLAAADRLDQRGDKVGHHAAEKLRRKANGARFEQALDDAGVFGDSSAVALQRDLTTNDTED